jgi:hypothetical protein
MTGGIAPGKHAQQPALAGPWFGTRDLLSCYQCIAGSSF